MSETKPEAPELDAMWQALKAMCCADPASAVRVAMVSEDAFKNAMWPFVRSDIASETKEWHREAAEKIIEKWRQALALSRSAPAVDTEVAKQTVERKRDAWQQKLEQANAISEEHDARVLDTRNGWRTCVAAANEILKELEMGGTQRVDADDKEK